MKMKPFGVPRIRLLPAWLWFWLFTYLISLPSLITLVWVPLIQDLLSSHYNFAVEMGFSSPFYQGLRITNLIELLPYLVVLTGVVLIFLPHLRGWFIERSEKLTAMDDLPVVQEIREFVQQSVPGIKVRVNMTAPNGLALAYPLGFRKPALGIFSGLIKLWRSDRKAAEAILLHEIAHFRHGDALIFGAGSLFGWIVSHWVFFYLVLVLIPLLLWSAGEIVYAWQRALSLGVFSAGTFTNTVLMVLLATVTSSWMELLNTFAIFLLPLVGIWSAELNADRYVLEATGSKELMNRVFAYLAPGGSWWQRVLFGATHPPVWLRRFLANHYRSWWAFTFLVILYPLAYPLLLVVKLAATMPLFVGGSGEVFVENFRAALITAGTSLVPIFFGMLIFLLIWPVIARLWPWLFLRKIGSAVWAGYPVYGFSAVFLLFAVILINSAVQPEPSLDLEQITAPAPQETIKIGQVFSAAASRVVVLDWEILSDHPALQAAENSGKAVVRVELNVLNAGEGQVYPPLNARLRDSQGKEYYYSINDAENSLLIDSETPSERLAPGEKVWFRLSYLVDKTAGDLQFIYLYDPPADMTRAVVALNDDPANRLTPAETLPE